MYSIEAAIASTTPNVSACIQPQRAASSVDPFASDSAPDTVFNTRCWRDRRISFGPDSAPDTVFNPKGVASIAHGWRFAYHGLAKKMISNPEGVAAYSTGVLLNMQDHSRLNFHTIPAGPSQAEPQLLCDF
jgi:hypothetical protein